MEQIHVRPHLSSPKPGGMMDAIRHDRFIDFLADKWPEDLRKKRMLQEGEIEDQSNDPNYPFKG